MTGFRCNPSLSPWALVTTHRQWHMYSSAGKCGIYVRPLHRLLKYMQPLEMRLKVSSLSVLSTFRGEPRAMFFKLERFASSPENMLKILHLCHSGPVRHRPIAIEPHVQ